MSNPKISVVTVAFNAADCIEKTILSVISQDYDNFQYVIIDGGSTDGTQEIVKRFSARIDHFVSETDGGIYYGMNKGIDAATGDYVLFLNSGDTFFDKGVLSDVVSSLSANADADILYGNVERCFEYGNFIVKPKETYINHKMSISHQASFVRRTLLKGHKFDVRYRYAADFEQLSSFYLNGCRFTYLDRTIASVDMTDGATYRHFVESANEMYDIIAARGIDIEDERTSQIRRKKIVRFVKNNLPRGVTNMLFGFLARHYKAM